MLSARLDTWVGSAADGSADSRESLIGVFIADPSLPVLYAVRDAGYDFAVLDLEHGVFDNADIAAVARAGDHIGLPIMARLKEFNRATIQAVLDMGVGAVQLPMVEDADLARHFVAATRTAAAGGTRGVSPLTFVSGYGARTTGEICAAADDTVVRSVQVESSAGMAAVDTILAVDGIDIVFVGLADLSASLALEPHGEPMHRVLAELGAAISDSGRRAAIYVDRVELVPQLRSMGYSIFVGTALSAIRSGLSRNAESMRRARTIRNPTSQAPTAANAVVAERNTSQVS